MESRTILVALGAVVGVACGGVVTSYGVEASAPVATRLVPEKLASQQVARDIEVAEPIALGSEPDAASQEQALEPREPEPREEEASECAPPEEPIDVLFIGNSYTNMHDLPALVEALGEQAGVPLHAEKLAVGGKNFEYHLARSKTAAVLEEGDWDVVVLQSHSLDPLRNPDGFFEAGEELVEMVEASGAEPLLFETWARKRGHNLYNYFKPTGGSPEEMQARVSESYSTLAERTGAKVIEVGRAWRALRTQAPQLDPYASDSAHPGKLGAYLTANVFFAALTDVSPVGKVEPLLDIDPKDAALIQRQAAAVIQPRCGTL
ncbi:hypothetical protein G6O69_34665 [Pseudenhygromyxa sp. WMMC2535]|uniref:DUF4886 domain-containing protein n=1 Tax=Pseudenhygromyxa sp. WMMC2535 TaxID=2712867 RepID=UPI001557C0B1|nr:DUF4886 domain-containing protein [Pseudenhygromyxa sp. WMMC2535]NVB43017.1 hypothetical protein [Pseudenhygromyxa sp. WMMC2535]